MQGGGTLASLTPVLSDLFGCSLQQLAAATASAGARQERKELNARPSHQTWPLPPPPLPPPVLAASSSRSPQALPQDSVPATLGAKLGLRALRAQQG